MLLVLLTCINLTGQGLYYDEVHQAVAAFAHIGGDPINFMALDFKGIPILNMSYSGAIKSNIYGVYLRFSDEGFTVRSWRLLGIVFVVASLFYFVVVAGRHLKTTERVVFLLLLLTDSTVILTTRHDWGPTALALSLRLIFLSIWLEREFGPGKQRLKNFGLGALVGLMIFEKLSSIALLPAFALILFSGKDGSIRARLAGLCGLVAGLLPLIGANVYSIVSKGQLISLSGLKEPSQPPLAVMPLLRYAYEYPSLAQGGRVRNMILGESVSGTAWLLEAFTILFLTIFILLLAVRSRHVSRKVRISALIISCYVATGLGLLLLPRAVGPHHWIIGTPFQYLGIALFLGSFIAKPSQRQVRGYIRCFTFALGFLVLLRLPALVSVEYSLVSGTSSSNYDPSFTRVAQFAKERSRSAVFVAADWGVASQVYCITNGQSDLTYEPLWGHRWKEEVLGLVKTPLLTSKSQLYLLARRNKPPIFPEKTAYIVHQIEASKLWREVEVEYSVTSLNEVIVRKFVRTESQSNPSRTAPIKAQVTTPQL